ncbi:LytR/AlgR family response regulator transcription factor [Flagellimonas okinawensis]|uniref:LytTR family DNA-binding domain-containing protein n=1 Tax=Flagellimonas okinawensis TaxID=3031324 RepID=A0ABT5XT59_9FLAO|nr:LytTR family DNA-binding domain-containing protein [[Muricauda] okinawensis]MDF0709078.1 LytTR family DNA-binding domain-containing protein [[Muricauda] okinawensis]
MIRAIALDDEKLALEVIRAYSDQIEYLDLIQTFTEQAKAVKYLNKFEVDLLFLDIQMPNLDGISLYKSLKQNPKVIFTTAFSQYAVEGFNVQASDYLLKPISFERFMTAVEKAKKELELQSDSIKENTHITVRADFKLYQIPLDDILFIEALDDYIQLHLESGNRITARSTMKGILKKLPDSRFKRAHRSYIVPIEKVKAIYKNTAKIGEHTIPLGNAYKEGVLKSL